MPDWPLSFGSLTPPWVGNIRYEHGHRMVAALVGLLTVCLAVWLWRREPRRWVRRLGLAALAAVVVQGVLGGITVLFLLPAPVSIAHASLAQGFFCLTVTLALVTGSGWQQPVRDGPPPLAQLATATTVAAFLQLMLGAALRHNVFGVVPHLIGASAVAILAFWTVRRSLAIHAERPALLFPACALAALVAVQLTLGLAAWLVREGARDAAQPLPMVVWITVAHVAFGALTLATSLALALLSRDRQGAVAIAT